MPFMQCFLMQKNSKTKETKSGALVYLLVLLKKVKNLIVTGELRIDPAARECKDNLKKSLKKFLNSISNSYIK